VRFQSRPAGESRLASDGELRVTELELGGEDFSIGGAAEAGMKFSDSLRHSGSVGAVLLEEVFRLILEMVEVGIRWETSDRHNELPFVCPRSALMGRKSVRENKFSDQGGLLSFPRTGCALRAGVILARGQLAMR